MKGFVQTPDSVVDFMVEALFRDKAPTADSTLLDPGCGNGNFIDGVLRWCTREHAATPKIVGIEFHPDRATEARQRFRNNKRVVIREADFLAHAVANFEYVIGNPPYVAITGLDAQEKAKYRSQFAGAAGRFDLYLLFFEHALKALAPGGRLVFITPEKFLYVSAAAPLRRQLAALRVDRLHLVDENTFEGLVTYPLISQITALPATGATNFVLRDGSRRTVKLPTNGASWLQAISARTEHPHGPTLADISERISCGIATGADSVFVMPTANVPRELRRFCYPTISGRQIANAADPVSTDSMVVPYRPDGTLFREDELGPLRSYLSQPAHKERLLARTCSDRKPWYAFHESPAPRLICRPKILCKDIGADPFFVLDHAGTLLPRHSVYYIIPSDPTALDALFEYLNSGFAKQWLRDHCQRAAKGFVRLQSHVLKQLPIPEELASGASLFFPKKKTA